MSLEPVLIADQWRESEKTGTFQVANPATGELFPSIYPISSWADCEAALKSAHAAFLEMRLMPGGEIATFLESFATKIEERAEALVEMAHLETALPKTPRLAGAELPRTTGQLRQAAAAARSGSWKNPVIDTTNNIRACFGPL